jgi:hypothetical protein
MPEPQPFISDVGTPEGDKGEFFEIQAASADAPAVRFRVRRIPDTKARAIEKKHGRDGQGEIGGFKRPQLIFDTRDALNAALAEKASWAWTDSENLYVRVADDEARDFYRRHLNDETIEVGASVKLDGRLNEAVKRRLMALEENLVGWTLRASASLDAELTKAEKARQGNS